MFTVNSALKYGETLTESVPSVKWHNVILHTIAVLLVIIIHSAENNPVITLYSGGVICAITYAYIGVSEAFNTHLRLNPLSFYMAWYSIGMGFSAIYAGSVVSSGESLSFVIKYIEPTDLVYGYVVYLIGSLFLHVGMEISAPRRSRVIREGQDQLSQNELLGIVILWAVGMLASLFPEQVKWMGAFAAVFQRLTPAAVIFVALNSSSRISQSKGIYYSLIIFGTVGAFVASLMANSKASIMFSLFPLFWMFVYRRHLWRYLFILLAGLIIFYFGLVAPVVMTARNLEMKEGETYAGRILRVYQSLDAESYQAAQEYQENGLELFLLRQFDAPAIGFLIDDVRAFGYRQGETMERLAYSFIPRILWPEKPTVTVGGWFYTYAGGQKDEAESDTSFGITATGECYWNFGILGVISGMLLIGLTIGGLWRMSGLDPRYRISRLFLYYSITLNICNMPDWVTVITLNVILFILCYTWIYLQNIYDSISISISGQGQPNA